MVAIPACASLDVGGMASLATRPLRATCLRSLSEEYSCRKIERRYGGPTAVRHRPYNCISHYTSRKAEAMGMDEPLVVFLKRTLGAVVSRGRVVHIGLVVE